MKYLAILIFVLLTSPAWATDMNLSWDPDPLATEYAVLQSVDGGTNWTQLATAPTPNFVVSAPDDGTLYLYRAVNRNTTGDTPRYTPTWAHDSDWVPPAAPSNLFVQ